MAESTAIELVSPKTIYATLEKMKPEMERALPRHIRADRMARVALTQLRMNPKLFNCTLESFLGSLLAASQLGWEPGINGQCYLVPYKNTCTLVGGWKGYIDLVARSGRASAWTGAVRPGDEFTYSVGDKPFVDQRPGDDDLSKFTHVWAVGRINGMEWPVVEVWSRAKVLAHLNQYNKVGDAHYALANENNLEMYGRKVALLQVIKYLPSSVEMRDALALDLSSAEGKQALTIDMAMKHELESGGIGAEDQEALARLAAEKAQIDKLFAELDTPSLTITKQRAKYIGNNKGLIEWLETQVAKKRNDGSGKKEPSAKDPTIPSTGTTTTQANTTSPATTTENPDAEPPENLFTEQTTKPDPVAVDKSKSKPAPPPVDTENWS